MRHIPEPEAVIAGLYEAAAIPEQWQDALAALASFTLSKTSHIFDWDPAVQAGNWGVVGYIPGAGIDPAADDVYRNHYGKVDPRRPLFQGTLDRIWNCAEAMADTDVPGSRELFNDFLVPNGVRWTMCATARMPDGRFVTMASLRDVQEGAYGEDEKRRLGFVLPHMAHLDRLRRRMAGFAVSAQLSTAALEQTAAGIILCDAAGRVLYANSAATRMAEAGGITLAHNRIKAERPVDEPRLARSIQAAAKPALMASSGIGGALRIRRDAAHGDLFILLAPLPATVVAGGFMAGPAAMLIIETGRLGRPTLGRHLVEWFGLSPAETRLALDLMEGIHLEEIAQRRGLRISTLRTQLSTVLSKTGTRRQAELMSVLGSLPRLNPKR